MSSYIPNHWKLKFLPVADALGAVLDAVEEGTTTVDSEWLEVTRNEKTVELGMNVVLKKETEEAVGAVVVKAVELRMTVLDSATTVEVGLTALYVVTVTVLVVSPANELDTVGANTHSPTGSNGAANTPIAAAAAKIPEKEKRMAQFALQFQKKERRKESKERE